MNQTHSRSRISAFSLIEVLISVMILSLGLLGLAAVFPVIIRQQRIAGDATQGIIVARAAEAYLRTNGLLNKRSIVVPGESDFDPTIANRTALLYLQKRRGWDLWRFDCVNTNGSLVVNGPTYRDLYTTGGSRVPQLWDTRSYLSGNADGLTADGLSDFRGDNYIFGTGMLTGRGFDEPVIPLRDRLWPAAYSSVDDTWKETKYANEPRFVWDVALMRDEAGTPGNVADDHVRIAIFVRRIDTGIRMPAREVQDDIYDPLALNTTSTFGFNQRPSPATSQFRNIRLADVLLCDSSSPVSELKRTRLTSNQEYCVPVAVDATATNLLNATPTLDGHGNYAALQTCFVQAFEDPDSATGTHYTRMVLDSSISNNQRSMLRQPNQRFADNLGNVYTVVKVDETNNNAVIITPPAPPSVREMAAFNQAVQIVYSPVPPATISIITIERR